MKQMITEDIPEFSSPVLLAAWPGVSNMAVDVASYLREKVGATEFAEIDPVDLFSPIGVLVKDNVVQLPEFPRNRFYVWNNPKTQRDIIMFIAEAQPSQNQYDLAHMILDMAQEFGVSRVYTFAAAIVEHTIDKSRVWSAVTDGKLIDELKQYEITFTGDFQIRGLNGLLLGAAKEKAMEGVCLLGETPNFAAEIRNPMANYAVLEVITKILEIEIDLSDAAQEAEQAAQEMASLAKDVMNKYISNFTQPIWEQNPSEEED